MKDTFKIQELRDHQVDEIRALSEGNYVFIETKTGSDMSLAYECLPLVRASRLVHQSNSLARAFDFAVRYTKGEKKVCELDRKPWLAKMRLSWRN